jgi:hypothetical protein
MILLEIPWGQVITGFGVLCGFCLAVRIVRDLMAERRARRVRL